MNKFIYIHFKVPCRKPEILARLVKGFDDALPYHFYKRIFRDYGNAVLVSAIANPRLTPKMAFFAEKDEHALVLDGFPFFEDYDSNKGWMGQLLQGFKTKSKKEVFEKLRGDYCYVERRKNIVFAASDVSGFNPIYAYETDDVIAFSNRQKLLHQMINEKGRIDLDSRAFAWIGAQGNVFGNASPYRGVRLIESSRFAMIKKNELTFGGFKRFYNDEQYVGRDPAELVSSAADAVLNQASIYKKLPLPNSTLDLTGGKDSRTVLAIAMQSGLIDQVEEVTTIGTDDNPEVIVARALADRIGLKKYRNIIHDRDFTMKPMEFTAEDAAAQWHGLRQRVTIFDGILSPQLGPSVVRSSKINFTGTGGEVFGNIRTGPASRLTSIEETYKWIENCQMPLDPLTGQPKELSQWQRRQLRKVADRYVAADVPLNDIQYLIWLETRFPWWAGYALANLMGRRRMFMMMNHDALGCMFSVPPVHKSMQHLHFELLRRAGPGFVETPFLKLPLDPRLQDHYPDIDIPKDPYPMPAKTPKLIGAVNTRIKFADYDWNELFAYMLDARESAVFDIVPRKTLENIFKNRKDFTLGRQQAVNSIFSLVTLRMIETDDGVPVKQGKARPQGYIDTRVQI